jgi:hypothetical protein
MYMIRVFMSLNFGLFDYNYAVHLRGLLKHKAGNSAKTSWVTARYAFNLFIF